MDEKKALQLARKLGTGLDEREVREARSYFKRIGREPTEIELQTIGQTWSEHCFHKVFKSPIQMGKNTINGLFDSFIQKATQEIEANWLVSTFKDNAGIIKFEETYSIAAKVETHNHPSAIDPFGGAATGVGGVIRDVLGVWAQPIANTDILCFGELNFPYSKLPSGIRHPKYLMKGVVAGVGSYGNNMGIPTVNGALYFDNSFAGYTLVFCGCIGLLKNRNYVKNAKPGDVLVIAGSRTGRDGIHGVNFASEKIGPKIDELRSAVQIPNPIVEERLKRAVLEIADRHLASAVTDLGGGGLSSATCESARNYGCGVEVDLASVPVSSQDLSPWEIWLSETQERMLIIVPEPTLAKVLSVFEREEIEASAFGKLTQGNNLYLHYRGESLGNLDLGFLFNPPLPKLVARATSPKIAGKDPTRTFAQANISADTLSILKAPNVASKEAIVRTYDHEVQGNTVLKPFQYPHSGPNDAAVIKPVPNSERGLVISCGFNPSYGLIDTYWMAASAIDEAIRNNVSAGGRRIALLDNFAWGNVDNPENLGSLVRAAEACYTFAKEFGTPFISGKDSLYNETLLGEIAPTIVITALGIVPEISRCVSSDFKQAGNTIYLVGETKSEFGGSEYFRLKNLRGGSVPQVDAKSAASLYRTMNRVLDQAFVRSCHDISSGGMAAALAEMSFARMLGATLSLPEIEGRGNSKLTPAEILFSESNSRFIVEVQQGEEDKFEKMMKGFFFARIGLVSSNRLQIHDSAKKKVVDLSIGECYSAWKSTFT
ncbi:MAG: phosphoribosylformylglycinamidine synthase subunit PurL [Nitrososphaerales archaeon]